MHKDKVTKHTVQFSALIDGEMWSEIIPTSQSWLNTQRVPVPLLFLVSEHTLIHLPNFSLAGHQLSAINTCAISSQ